MEVYGFADWGEDKSLVLAMSAKLEALTARSRRIAGRHTRHR